MTVLLTTMMIIIIIIIIVTINLSIANRSRAASYGIVEFNVLLDTY